MSKNRSAYFISLMFLAGIALFPLAKPKAFQIDESVSASFASFPENLGSWTGKDEPLDKRTFEILETKNILSRTFTSKDGKNIHLLLVGSHRDRRVAHPPEVCYTGSNYSVIEKKDSSFVAAGETVLVKEFTARSEKKGAPLEHVLYFYKVGGKLTPNYYEQQLRFMIDKLTGQETQVLLVRAAAHDPEIFSDFLPLVIQALEKL